MMRRAAAVAVVLVTLIATGPASHAQAHAGPGKTSDPVAALQRALVKGHGIRFFTHYESDFTTDGEMDKGPIRGTDRGRVEFSDGGLHASDLTSRSPDNKDDPWPVRWITFKGRHYVHDRTMTDDGKWGKYEWTLVMMDHLRPRLDNGDVNLLSPATLKAVLATTKSRHTTPAGTLRLEGTITTGALYKADRDIYTGLNGKLDAEEAKNPIAWRLWIGKDGLIRRAWTAWTFPITPTMAQHLKKNMRITGWGSKVKITPPRSYVGD
ncbi:hypothetical protein [Spongiactinospora sp. TRM90649]|uniref:hypothetical protein n=1 Tax=Spongiactinospora sp. TRM90649 TaxID=3031114 RepID=UPI0023FA48F9|nr:hypothetical protein [Spongiactinospora sp. TRM90649]MDF5758446.1 hypothetical protein [Spongiactinospora sp. TRM90649]